MKTCGQCTRFFNLRCYADVPVWAKNQIENLVPRTEPNDEQAEDCDCFKLKSAPARGEGGDNA